METAAQLAWLRGLGCDYAQGYFFWRPMDSARLRALLEARRTEDITVVGPPRI